jgi:hypothetical protein
MVASQLDLPRGVSFTSDRQQYNGEGISINAQTCPEPLGPLTGLSNCPVWCRSTCMDLNPDRRAAVLAEIAHIEKVVPYINQAIVAAKEAVLPMEYPIQVTGSVTFRLHPDASDAVVATVEKLVETQLGLYSPFIISNFTVRLESSLRNVSGVFDRGMALFLPPFIICFLLHLVHEYLG